MSTTSDAVSRGWNTRRKKYGSAGRAQVSRPSDKITDAQYFEKLKALCTIEPNGCWMYQGFRFKPPRH